MFFLNIGLERWFGRNFSAPKRGCVKQALHGFLEFELFKTRFNNHWNLWKTNNFALLQQHVCNKYLHLATSRTRHSFASHWLVFHLMPSWPMLKFGGESSSVESGLPSTASKLNYVSGDELDIVVSIELFWNQTILRWCHVVCVATLHMPPYWSGDCSSNWVQAHP